MCRDKIRKAKAQMEQNFVKDVKDNKKEFYRYIGRRRQAKESIPPLVKGNGELASSDKKLRWQAGDCRGCARTCSLN